MYVQGRYPGKQIRKITTVQTDQGPLPAQKAKWSNTEIGPMPLRDSNITKEISYIPEHGTFLVRLDDNENPDFWMQLTFTQEELDNAKRER